MASNGHRKKAEYSLPVPDCNNLERYLEDIYENEVIFKDDKNEINFVQQCIEYFVSKIVTIVKSMCSDALKRKCTKFLIRHRTLQITSTEEEVIGVGSFYEGTKNNYPNESDFLFIIATFDIKRDDGDSEYSFPDYEFKTDLSSINFAIGGSIPHVVEELKHGPNEEGRHLCFVEYVGQHGPAFTFKFLYSDSSGTKKYIHVDLVPAIKIVGINTTEAQKCCRLRQFAEHVESTRSVLVVRENISLTESEISFMKNILSRKHKLIYQILKYLIGGHGEGERMRKVNPRKGYSSYMIKVAVIEHHYDCASSAEPELGPCLLAVLKSLIRHKESGSCYPTLTLQSFIDNEVGTSEEIVKDLIKELGKIQNSRKKYDYLRVRRNPVAVQWRNRGKRCQYCCTCFLFFLMIMMLLYFGYFCGAIVSFSIVNNILSATSTTPNILSNGSQGNYSL